MIEISVIIPCFNKEKYLEECIDSVILSDINTEFEIVIVDDCSKDNCFKIAESYTKQIDGIKLIKNKENVKQSASRNIGIKNSVGKFIVCLDADDKIPQNYLQAHYDNIKLINVDISYSNSQCFQGSSKNYNWPEFDVNILRRSPFINCSAMFKRIVWEKVGGFDESFIYGSEDYDFWLSAAKKGFKFSKCKKTCLQYRVIEDGITNTKNHENSDRIKKMLKKKYGDFYLEI